MNAWKQITTEDADKLAAMTPIFEHSTFTSNDRYYAEVYDGLKTRLIIERHYSSLSKFAEYSEDGVLDYILIVPQEQINEWVDNFDDKKLTDAVLAAAELH